MALLTAGYWPTVYWVDSYWEPLYWPAYGVTTATVVTVDRTMRLPSAYNVMVLPSSYNTMILPSRYKIFKP